MQSLGGKWSLIWAGNIWECFIKEVVVKGTLMRIREPPWAPHLHLGESEVIALLIRSMNKTLASFLCLLCWVIHLLGGWIWLLTGQESTVLWRGMSQIAKSSPGEETNSSELGVSAAWSELLSGFPGNKNSQTTSKQSGFCLPFSGARTRKGYSC